MFFATTLLKSTDSGSLWRSFRSTPSPSLPWVAKIGLKHEWLTIASKRALIIRFLPSEPYQQPFSYYQKSLSLHTTKHSEGMVSGESPSAVLRPSEVEWRTLRGRAW